MKSFNVTLVLVIFGLFFLQEISTAAPALPKGTKDQCVIKVYKGAITSDPHGYITLTEETSNIAPFIEEKDGKIFNIFSSFNAVTQNNCDLCDMIVYSSKTFSGKKQVLDFSTAQKFYLDFCAKSFEIVCPPEEPTLDLTFNIIAHLDVHVSYNQETSLLDFNSDLTLTVNTDAEVSDPNIHVLGSETINLALTAPVSRTVISDPEGNIIEQIYEIDADMFWDQNILVDTTKNLFITQTVASFTWTKNIIIDPDVETEIGSAVSVVIPDLGYDFALNIIPVV